MPASLLSMYDIDPDIHRHKALEQDREANHRLQCEVSQTYSSFHNAAES